MPTFVSGYQNGYRGRVEVALQSQSTEANTSTLLIQSWIDAQAGFSFTNASITCDTWLGPSGGSAVQVDSNSAGRSVGSGGSVMVGNITRTITHNADGAYSVAISSHIVAGSLIVFDQWVGGDYALPTIPRATTPTWSGNFEAGTAKTISLPRASGGFTHNVSFGFGSANASIATGVGTSLSWTPPLSLLEEIPNAASATGTLWVQTFSGGTLIGAKAKSFTLAAPSSVVPTVSTVLWDDANTTVKANVGAFVQGLSQITGAVTAAGVYGSTIASRAVLIGAAQTQVAEGTPFTVAGSGTITAAGRATDSRGRVGTLAANFTVLAYTPPQATAVQVRRANSGGTPTDDGTHLRLDLTASVQSLVVGAEKNAMTVVVKTREIGASSWVTRNTLTPGLTYDDYLLIGGGGVYLATTSYEVQVTISDRCGQSYVAETTVATAVVTLDLNGSQVGVGKMHERGGLDVAGDIYSNGSVLCPIGSCLTWFTDTAPDGWLLCRGQAVSRTTYAALYAVIGTQYGAGNGSTTFNLPNLQGRVPVGKSSDTEFDTLGKTAGAKTHTLTGAEIPAHQHRLGHNYGGNLGYAESSGGPTQYTVGYGVTRGSHANDLKSGAQDTTTGQAHNNIQPSLTANFIIRAL